MIFNASSKYFNKKALATVATCIVLAAGCTDEMIRYDNGDGRLRHIFVISVSIREFEISHVVFRRIDAGTAFQSAKFKIIYIFLAGKPFGGYRDAYISVKLIVKCRLTVFYREHLVDVCGFSTQHKISIITGMFGTGVCGFYAAEKENICAIVRILLLSVVVLADVPYVKLLGNKHEAGLRVVVVYEQSGICKVKRYGSVSSCVYKSAEGKRHIRDIIEFRTRPVADRSQSYDRRRQRHTAYRKQIRCQGERCMDRQRQEFRKCDI